MITPLLLSLLALTVVEPPPPAGQISLASRDWTVVLDGARAWSIHHVDYQGQLVAHDRGAQTVCLDAGQGLIGGTNHEGGPETCSALTLEVDGETAPFEVGRTYQGATVTAVRVSRLDQLQETQTIQVTDDQLTVKVELEAMADQPVKQLLGFLMNWQTRFDRWAALKQTGDRIDGEFSEDNGRVISAPAAWACIYDSEAKLGFVSWSTTPPDLRKGGTGTSFWDAKNYHKQFLSIMGNSELAKGETLQAEIHVSGFQAAPDAWIDRAQEIAGVEADPTAALTPGLLTVTTRDWRVVFDPSRAWTIYETAYQGESASHHNGFHGAVINTGVPAKEGTTSGWLGTGHNEGGQEQVLQTSFALDGQPLKPKAGVAVTGSRFELVKDSLIGKLEHHAQITVTDDRITEHHTFEATADQPVVTMYAFMHCWEPTFDQWIAQPAEGDRLSGEFQSDDNNEVNQDVTWSAIYDSGRGFGVVTAYPEAYPSHDRGAGTFYWDKSNYHKQYLNIWGKGTIGAGTKLDYTLVLQGFKAAAGEWRAKAAALAAGAF